MGPISKIRVCIASPSDYFLCLLWYFKGGCDYGAYIGDSYCDDQNNFEECGYDGGDCCPYLKSNDVTNLTDFGVTSKSVSHDDLESLTLMFISDLWNLYCFDCECKNPKIQI